MTIESLLKDTELTATIKVLVRGSARSYPGQEEAQPGVVTNLSVVPDKQKIANDEENIRLPNQDPKIKSIAVL